MSLCGASSCGCALVAAPSTSGAVGGEYPQIQVAGGGSGVSPWIVGMNSDWTDAVADTINPTAWTDVSFVNSWANDAGEQNVQYRKIGDLVFLRGRADSGTSGTTVFTLPVGLRPPTAVRFATIGSGGIARVDVGAGGGVSAANQAGSDVAAGVEFNGVVFTVTA